jgi:hypothetical protein
MSTIASELGAQVQAYINRNSNYDTKRDYLGMSGIGRCPRQLYDNYFNPKPPSDEHLRGCYLGYLWEDETKDILEGAKIYRPDSERELVAPFDSRFVGHTDGETTAGELLEIKSVNARGLDRVKAEGRIKRDHFYQVQTYMRYGNYRSALVALVCRDPMEFHFVMVPAVANVGEQMERKAKAILKAIDARERPACECGYCK